MEQISIKCNNTSAVPIFRLINLIFQGVNRLFLLSFENTTDRSVHTKYCLPPVEIKVYNITTDGRNFFDGPVKNNLRTYDNIWLHE